MTTSGFPSRAISTAWACRNWCGAKATPDPGRLGGGAELAADSRGCTGSALCRTAQHTEQPELRARSPTRSSGRGSRPKKLPPTPAGSATTAPSLRTHTNQLLCGHPIPTMTISSLSPSAATRSSSPATKTYSACATTYRYSQPPSSSPSFANSPRPAPNRRARNVANAIVTAELSEARQEGEAVVGGSP